MIWLLAAACSAAAAPAGLRWLRVAQREHYIPGSVSRFAWRWWTIHPLNVALLALGGLGMVGSHASTSVGFLVPLSQVGPVGLPVNGVTSPLAWTERLRRLALLSGGMFSMVIVVGVVAAAPPVVAAGPLLLPLLIDFSLAILRPVERRLGSRWVERAARKLGAIAPEVVAITGSYGKTST